MLSLSLSLSLYLNACVCIETERWTAIVLCVNAYTVIIINIIKVAVEQGSKKQQHICLH